MFALTLLEVVRLAHVDADECHELQLGETLSCWRREGQQVPQVRYLRVDEVAAQLARALGRLARIEPARDISHITVKSSTLWNVHRLNSVIMNYERSCYDCALHVALNITSNGYRILFPKKKKRRSMQEINHWSHSTWASQYIEQYSYIVFWKYTVWVSALAPPSIPEPYFS